jgi:hypothetical protein
MLHGVNTTVIPILPTYQASQVLRRATQRGVLLVA